jgi:signal peptidase I
MKILLYILFLPFFLIKDTLKSPKKLSFKICYTLIFSTIFIFTWYRGYANFFQICKESLYQYGIYDKLTKVKVTGDSMLPIIIPMESGGGEITLHSPKKYSLERGDIVSFINTETSGIHYIKRIIGLPGEKITLKNGYVFVNDKALVEDYTLDQLPTFGNTFLNNCYPQTVPKNHFLVLGDNRTVSMDSRVIGFISKDDIDGVIKTKLNYEFQSDNIQSNILKNKINPELLIQKINTIRKEKNTSELLMNKNLNEIAELRSKSIVENFSNWKKSSTPLKDLLQKNNYKSSAYYEFVTFGYLDEENIVKQILESSIDKIAFMSGNFYEIGVASDTNTVGDCSFPVITIIISWPDKPTYSPEIISFWADENTKNNKKLALLQDAMNYPGANIASIQEVKNILIEMSNISSNINQQIANNEWLDTEQLDRYAKLVKEIKSTMEKQISSTYGSTYTNYTQPVVTPTIPPNSNPRLHSNNLTNIDKGATAIIDSAFETSTTITIKLTFSNTTYNIVDVHPIHLSMRNKKYGTADINNSYINYPLNPNSKEQLSFTFDKLDGGGPYSFYYWWEDNKNGVVLATYD